MWEHKDIEEMTSRITSSLGEITKKAIPLQHSVEQLIKQQTPIRSVNAELNGKQAVVSLMKDDSIVIRFKNPTEANTYFNVLIFRVSKLANLKNAIRCLFT